jgi:dGTPase
LAGRRLLFETIRLMLSDQVYDVIDTTRALIGASGVQSLADVRSSPGLVAFSLGMRERSQVLKTFLLRNLYRHPQVVETTDRARRVVADLFDLYLNAPNELPEAHSRSQHHARAVADYIAGMTDRFAIREHERLFGAVIFT